MIFSIISLMILTISINSVSADGGSIAKVKYYPEDGGFYESISHFMEQVTAVNPNTTVWVSIDNKSMIQMTYQGLIIEYAEKENRAVEWHTWKTEVIPIVTPGIHTFQFFKQYTVWQEDQYWAAFYAYSEEKTFIITEPPTQTKENEIKETESNHYINSEISDMSGFSEISGKHVYDISKIQEFSTVLPSATVIIISILLILFLNKIMI